MTMFNSHPIYLIGFYIKWTIWYWGESLIWLEVFMAEWYYNKERFMIRTHAYSAHEVMIHSYWDILQADISEKLSRQTYSCSPSFFASFSLSILHITMKGALFTLLPPQYVTFWRPPRHHSWGYVFQDFFPQFKIEALLNRQVSASKHYLKLLNRLSDSGCNPIWCAHWRVCPRDCAVSFRQ